LSSITACGSRLRSFAVFANRTQSSGTKRNIEQYKTSHKNKNYNIFFEMPSFSTSRLRRRASPLLQNGLPLSVFALVDRTICKTLSNSPTQTDRGVRGKTIPSLNLGFKCVCASVYVSSRFGLGSAWQRPNGRFAFYALAPFAPPSMVLPRLPHAC
jgi:hypothetical protein